jgi:hypothetical protein
MVRSPSTTSKELVRGKMPPLRRSSSVANLTKQLVRYWPIVDICLRCGECPLSEVKRTCHGQRRLAIEGPKGRPAIRMNFSVQNNSLLLATIAKPLFVKRALVLTYSE